MAITDSQEAHDVQELSQQDADRPHDHCNRRCIPVGLVTTAIQRSAITALGRQRYFIKNGEYPKSLSLLSSEYLPADADITDPFVGGPLKSSMDAAGLVIYGVGMNKGDDGGEVIPTEDRHHAKDAGLVHGW